MVNSEREAGCTGPGGTYATLKERKEKSVSAEILTHKTTGVIFLTIHVKQNLKSPV
jgi:predicted metal-dependent phosphotriesterase family hydrolase